MAQTSQMNMKALASMLSGEMKQAPGANGAKSMKTSETSFAEVLTAPKAANKQTAPLRQTYTASTRDIKKAQEAIKHPPVKPQDPIELSDPIAVAVPVNQIQTDQPADSVAEQTNMPGKIIPTLLLHPEGLGEQKQSQNNDAAHPLSAPLDPVAEKNLTTQTDGLLKNLDFSNPMGNQLSTTTPQVLAAPISEEATQIAQKATQDMAQSMAQDAALKTSAPAELKPMQTGSQEIRPQGNDRSDHPALQMERSEAFPPQDTRQESTGNESRSQGQFGTASQTPSSEAKSATFNASETLTTGGTGIGNAVNNAARAQLAAQAEASKPTLTPTLVDQIKVNIRQAMDTGLNTISVKLRPEHLGSVEVTLEMIDKSIKSVHIMADRPEALQALKDNGAQLTKSLGDLGFDTSSGDLNFSLQGQDKQNQENQSTFSSNIQKKTSENSTDISLESVALQAQERLGPNNTYSLRI